MIQNSTVAGMVHQLLTGMWEAARRPARPLSFEGGRAAGCCARC
ncbi:hypothetical protein NKH77_20525 [Streptomyces sp. M19]